jgi:hypothetical protein
VKEIAEKNLLRTESRVIRPFSGIESFDGLLRGVSLTVNGQSSLNDKHSLDESQFNDLNLAFEISLKPVEIGLAAAEIFAKVDDLDLVVIAYGKTFKNAEVIRRWNLAQDEIEPGFTFHSSDMPDVIEDNFGGFHFVFAIVLAEERAQEPLKVYQAGTWLVKKEFAFTPNRDTSLFAPSPMDSDMKVELKIPKKTLIYIQEGEERIDFAAQVQDAVKVWVDSDLLSSLERQNSPASEVVQMLLGRTAIGAVVDLIGKVIEDKDFDVNRLAENLSSRREDSEDTVLEKFVRRAHKVLKNAEYAETIEELRADAQKVAAKMEADADLLGEIKRALAKEEL